MAIVKDIKDIQIGDLISCKYSAANGEIGSFSELNACTDELITDLNNPSGLFNWIYVDDDHFGRKILVADRNIQLISYNALNKHNITTGIELAFKDSDVKGYEIRLLTGGINDTDVDNEWNKYIISSNLNNSVTPDDDNVWHHKAISSLTSTTKQNSNDRVLRGGNENYSSGTFTDNYGFRPVLIMPTPQIPTQFECTLLPTSIHNENVKLTGYLRDNNSPWNFYQYKILVNDDKVYPATDYTPYDRYLQTINYEIDNKYLTMQNNKVSIVTHTELNDVFSKDLYVTLYNNNPNGVLQLDKIETSNENINLTGTLSDKDLDKISYRILLNDNELTAWNDFSEDPYIDYTINYKKLAIGQNTLKVEYKDNYKLEGIGEWQQKIALNNLEPIVTVKYQDNLIITNISDEQGDYVKYRVLINNNQVYPNKGYTDFIEPGEFIYVVNRKDIIVGSNNNVMIEVVDEFDRIIKKETTFMGDYIGLMFCDETKQYYTSDIGQLIKYLDFGIITLGQTSEVKKVIVQNRYGLSFENIEIWLNNNLSNIKVQLSNTRYPFIPVEELKFDKVYSPNEEEEFYVRIESNLSVESTSGQFEIYSKGTPMN